MGYFDHDLPRVIEPVGDICVPLFIPNHTDYVGLLVRVLRTLEQDRLYQRDESYSALVVREQWATRTITPLIEALANELGCQSCDMDGCIEYAPFASFIEFFPQDPYTEQELVPTGYNNSPFWVFDFTLPSILPDIVTDTLIDLAEWTTGYERGDVILPITAFPLLSGANFMDVLTDGLPRIRINVEGSGTLALHLLNVPLGGRVLVSVDVSFSPMDIINGIISDGFKLLETNRDLLSVPPELDEDNIEEIEIETDGVHFVDVVFLPALDDALIPFNFGGGIRKVVLCGDLRPSGQAATPQNFGSGDLPSRFRLTASCGMEYQIYDPNNGNAIIVDWTQVDGWATNANACFQGDIGLTGADGVDGTNGIDGADGADGVDGANGLDGADGNVYPDDPTQATNPDGLCGSSWYIAEQLEALCQDALTNMQTITFAEWISAGTWFEGWDTSIVTQLWNYGFANSNPNFSTELSSAISEIAEYLYCNDLDKTATLSDIQASSTISADAKAMYPLAFNSVTDGKWSLWAFVGSQDTTRDCSSFVCGTWCYTFDFTVSDGGFSAYDGQDGEGARAVYAAGLGWTNNSSNVWTEFSQIKKTFGFSAQLTDVEFTASKVDVYDLRANDVTFDEFRFTGNAASASHATNKTITGLFIHAGDNAAPSSTYGGYIQSVTLRGVGTNPFGTDNCV